MDKQSNKSTKEDRQSTAKKSLAIGGVIVVLVIATPFVFYSYKSFPEGSNLWETSFFTLETSFTDWYGYAWFMVGKIVPLYLLLLWFFTCRHWWHWVIIVPIAMYSFQIWGLIRQSNGRYDELEIYYVIPLLLIIVPFVYLTRAKLFSKVRGDDLKSFEEELGTQKSIWGQIKDLFR